MKGVLFAATSAISASSKVCPKLRLDIVSDGYVPYRHAVLLGAGGLCSEARRWRARTLAGIHD